MVMVRQPVKEHGDLRVHMVISLVLRRLRQSGWVLACEIILMGHLTSLGGNVCI